MKVENFGTTSSGVSTKVYTLENDRLTCRVTDYGACLVDLITKDKEGNPVNVVLGFDDVKGYEADLKSIGCNIGRNANRLGYASFELNGTTYELEKNNGEHNLHSGSVGIRYSKRMWEVENCTDTSITFSLFSPHMDQGFPGNLKVFITYELKENELSITFSGTPDQDTIINMTNHSYFNLDGAGSGSVLDQIVTVYADQFTVSDAGSVPTGECRDVAGTPMDFRTPKTMAQGIESDYDQLVWAGGYDHNYCIRQTGAEIEKAVEIHSDKTGITMEVWTDYPGVQMYTANSIADIKGRGGKVYNRREAVCFEPQYYPDAIHHANFPSPVQKAGVEFKKKIVYVLR